MSAIKIHLDDAEMHPVHRLAESLHLSTEDVAYAALNRLMLEARAQTAQEEIVRTSRWRHDNLPLWADTAGSVHAYECQPDCEPEKSHLSI